MGFAPTHKRAYEAAVKCQKKKKKNTTRPFKCRRNEHTGDTIVRIYTDCGSSGLPDPRHMGTEIVIRLSDSIHGITPYVYYVLLFFFFSHNIFVYYNIFLLLFFIYLIKRTLINTVYGTHGRFFADRSSPLESVNPLVAYITVYTDISVYNTLIRLHNIILCIHKYLTVRTSIT